MSVRVGFAILVAILIAFNRSGPGADHVAAGAPHRPSQLRFRCPAGGPPDTLLVSRFLIYPNSPGRFGPARWVVRDRAKAVALFRATCALWPVVGKHRCPAGIGVTYRIRFDRRGKTILRVVVRADGCTWLYRGDRVGAGQAWWVWFGSGRNGDLWFPSARRWTIRFGQALDVPLDALSPRAGTGKAVSHPAWRVHMDRSSELKR